MPESKDDFLSIDHPRRWPKIEALFRAHTVSEGGVLPDTFQNPDSHAMKMVYAAYERALFIHHDQQRQETIGEDKAEYIFHIEEVLKDFLETVSTLPESLVQKFRANATEYVITLLLHDTIEDFDIARSEWNFDTVFDHVCGDLGFSKTMEKKVRRSLRYITKTVCIKDREERNEEYYERLQNAPFFLRLMKLCDTQNNVDTLDETDISSSKASKIMQFIEILDNLIANEQLPKSLEQNMILFQMLRLADQYCVREFLQRFIDKEGGDALLEPPTTSMDDARKIGHSRFYAQKTIIQSLYIWSKAIGYMLRYEAIPTPQGETEVDSSQIPPLLFLDDELDHLPSIREKIENIKRRLQNPEKLITTDMMMRDFLDNSGSSLFTESVLDEVLEELSSERFRTPIEFLHLTDRVVIRKALIDQGVPPESRSFRSFKTNLLKSMRQGLRELTRECRADIRILRREAVAEYKVSGWIPTRDIGPNMTKYNEPPFGILEGKSTTIATTIDEEATEV